MKCCPPKSGNIAQKNKQSGNIVGTNVVAKEAIILSEGGIMNICGVAGFKKDVQVCGVLTVDTIQFKNGGVIASSDCIQDAVDQQTEVCVNDADVMITIDAVNYGLATNNGSWKYGDDIDIAVVEGIAGKSDPDSRVGIISMLASGAFSNATGLGTVAAANWAHAEGR